MTNYVEVPIPDEVIDTLIRKRVNSEVVDWETEYLSKSVDRFVEAESTARKPREFKVVRATMARRLRDRLGADVFAGLYDSSVLEVE